MDKLYIIVKNEHGNPKIPVRWGIRGDGTPGYCMNGGHIVCFESFAEADRVLMSFTNPHWFDILEFKRDEIANTQQDIAE